MSRPTSLAAAASFLIIAGPAAGQSSQGRADATAPPAAHTHKHYDVPEQASQPGPNGELAPRLQALGSHTFPVTTKHADAQKFISQGVNLAYAFNHAEA